MSAVPRTFLTRFEPWIVLTGVLLSLLGGSLLGAYALGVRALGRDAPLLFIQAHAHSQLFGFLALFLCGFGHQLLPRFVRRPLPFPRLARLTAPALALGAVLHLAGQLWSPWGGGRVAVALSGPLIAVGGVTLALNLGGLLRGAFRGAPPLRWVRSGAALLAVACVGMGLLSLAGALAGRPLYPSALSQAVWITALHGGALLFTLGVAGRLLTALMGGAHLPRWVNPLGPAWCAAVLLHALCWVLPVEWPARPQALAATGALLGACVLWAALAFAVAFATVRIRIHEPFLLATVWFTFSALAAAGALRVAGELAVLPQSTPWPDAERHLVSIGFLTVLAAGLATQLLPGMVGAPLGLRRLRWPMLVLLCAGVALRTAPVVLTGPRWALAASGALTWGGLLLLLSMLGATALGARRRAAAQPGP